MNKNYDPTKVKLDDYEREIEREFAKGNFISDNNEEHLAEIVQAAREFKKTKSVNIRFNETDLAVVQKKAGKIGMPYQTLIKSLVHQFANGRINITL